MANTRLTTLRYKDWTIRWTEFMVDCQALSSDLRLDWEDMNCIKWACMGVEAITGENPYEPYEGTHGMIGAAKRIKADGFETLDELLDSLFVRVPIGMCQSGDIVMVKQEESLTIEEARQVMPHAVALADPPFYWAITTEGLGKGDLYTDGVYGLAVGRVVL